MAAQERRTAGDNRAYGAALNRTQAMAGTVGPAMRAKDVGELHLKPRTERALCSLTRRGRLSDQIQGRRSLRQMLLRQLEIAHGGAQITVAHEPLDRVQIRAGLQ
jgi:hypothetical protein